MDLSRHARIALGIVVAAMVLVPAVVLWPFTVDDAYITLRYARHLAAGLGPVFQTGLPRAEGCTSIAWVALLALPHALHLDALATAKGIGVACALGAVALAARAAGAAARDAGDRTGALATWVAAIALAALPNTAVHAVSGMETAAFTLAVLALAVACMRVVRGTAARVWPIGALALACGLLRPEGNLLALVAVLAAGAAAPARRGAIARAAVLGWVVPGALYFFWRWRFYGHPLPLPFYVKMGSTGALPGAYDTGRFLILVAPMLALALPVLARPPRALWPALAIALALIAFSLLPEPIMGYFLRFSCPAAGPLAVLAGAGAARWAALLRTRTSPAFAAVIVIALALIPLGGLGYAIGNRLLYARDLARAHVALGHEMARLPPGTVALSDCGAIPYLSEWRAVDLVGLNDAHVAITKDRSPEYVFGQRPDLLVLVSADSLTMRSQFWNRYEPPLLDAALARGWTVVSRRELDRNYWLWLVMRPDDPRATALATR